MQQQQFNVMFKKTSNNEKKNDKKSKFLQIDSNDNLKYNYILNKKAFKVILLQKNNKPRSNLLVSRIITLYS